MWLLKVGSYDLVRIQSADVPPYAILSHTWGDDEVEFADMQSPEHVQTARTKASWPKIEYTCRQARADGYDYVWIDSCCIDKKSSSELSEAINSMFAWYRDAGVCYAYLEGVPADVDTSAPESAFGELLAPSHVIFFSHDWIKINDRASLSRALSVVTGIDEPILAGTFPIHSASIAKRMSWAARRETTRAEDTAYSLLGIFDVNMPLLYGEGAQNAFLRLQKEIIGKSDDHSLFAWVDSTLPWSNRPQGETLRSLDRTQTLYGLLAPSPSYFENSKTMVRSKMPDDAPGEPYIVTNRGLRIDLHLIPLSQNLYVAVLNCPPLDQKEDTFLGVHVRKLGPNQFARVGAGFTEIPAKLKADLGKRETIFVRQTDINAHRIQWAPDHILRLGRLPVTLASPGYMLEFIWDPLGTGLELDKKPSGKSSTALRLPSGVPRSFIVPTGPVGRVVAALLFRRRPDDERLLVLLGLSGIFNMGCQLIELPPPPPSQRDDDHGLCSSASVGERVRRTLLDGQVLTLDAAEDLFVRRKEALKYHRVKVHFNPHWHLGVKFYMMDLDVEVLQLSDRHRQPTPRQPLVLSHVPHARHTPPMQAATALSTSSQLSLPIRPSTSIPLPAPSSLPDTPAVEVLHSIPKKPSVWRIFRPSTPNQPSSSSQRPETPPARPSLKVWQKSRLLNGSQLSLGPMTPSQPSALGLLRTPSCPSSLPPTSSQRPITRHQLSQELHTPPSEAVTPAPKKPWLRISASVLGKLRHTTPSHPPTPNQSSTPSHPLIKSMLVLDEPPVQVVTPTPRKSSAWERLKPTTRSPSQPSTSSHLPHATAGDPDVPIPKKKPSVWHKIRPSTSSQPPPSSQPPTPLPIPSSTHQPPTPNSLPHTLAAETTTPIPVRPSVWQRFRSSGSNPTPTRSPLEVLDAPPSPAPAVTMSHLQPLEAQVVVGPTPKKPWVW